MIDLFMAYKYPICDVFHWFCKIARFFATEPLIVFHRCKGVMTLAQTNRRLNNSGCNTPSLNCFPCSLCGQSIRVKSCILRPSLKVLIPCAFKGRPASLPEVLQEITKSLFNFFWFFSNFKKTIEFHPNSLNSRSHFG